MQNKKSWLNFPSDLDPPSVRSLGLLFVLDEIKSAFAWIHTCKIQIADNADLLFSSLPFHQFLSTNSSFPQNEMFPNKLCFYCDILLQASKGSDLSFIREVDSMRITALEFRTDVVLWKKRGISSSKAIESTLLFLSSLHQKLQSFFSCLIPLLNEARTDENVLLWLIEERTILNRDLGPHYIDHILQRFFPSGYAHLRAILCEGFTRRGFASFLSEKEHLIEGVEWATPCLVIHD